MGSNHAVDGKVMQGHLDEKSKEVDRLTVKNDIYQLVILEEMQNPTLLPSRQEILRIDSIYHSIASNTFSFASSFTSCFSVGFSIS